MIDFGKLDWQKTGEDFEKAPAVAPHRIPDMLGSIWCKRVLIAYRNNLDSLEGQKVSFLGALEAPGFGDPSWWWFLFPLLSN